MGFALLVATIVGRPAHASGLPAELLGNTFRLFLVESPTGLEFANRLLGVHLQKVGFRDYGKILQTLALPENAALTQEIVTRAGNLERDMVGRSIEGQSRQIGYIRTAAIYEFKMAARAPEGYFRFATGETYLVTRPNYEATMAEFARGGPAPVIQPSVPPELPPALAGQQLTNVGRDLKPAMETLRNYRHSMQSDRMIMFLDGSPEASQRLLTVMRSYIRAAKQLDATIRVVEARGMIGFDEFRHFKYEIDQMKHHAVTREARRIFAGDELASETLDAYLAATKTVGRASKRVGSIVRLPGAPAVAAPVTDVAAPAAAADSIPPPPISGEYPISGFAPAPAAAFAP